MSSDRESSQGIGYQTWNRRRGPCRAGHAIADFDTGVSAGPVIRGCYWRFDRHLGGNDRSHRRCGRVTCVEMIVHADFHFAEIFFDSNGRPVREREISRAKIQEIVFGLGRPRRRERDFEAGADSAA